MRVFLDLAKLYGTILGGGLIAVGVYLLPFGFINLLFFPLALALSTLLFVMGSFLLWSILRRPRIDIRRPAIRPHFDYVPDGKIAGPPGLAVMHFPSIWLLFICYFVFVGLGMLALAASSLAAFAVPYVMATTFPALAWMAYVYGQEALEPEPARLVLIALAGGILAIIPAVILNQLTLLSVYYALYSLHQPGAELISTIFLAIAAAPLIEEAFKPLVLWLLRREIHTELDGLMYGFVAGMGFALIENMAYLWYAAGPGPSAYQSWAAAEPLSWGTTALVRGLGSILVHGIGAGLIGRAYARKVLGRGSLWGVAGAYCLAVLVHGGWNGVPTLMTLDLLSLGVSIAIIAAFVTTYALGVFMLLWMTIKMAKREDSAAYEIGTKSGARVQRYEKARMMLIEGEWRRQHANQHLDAKDRGRYYRAPGPRPPSSKGVHVPVARYGALRPGHDLRESRSGDDGADDRRRRDEWYDDDEVDVVEMDDDGDDAGGGDDDGWEEY